jgi:NAD(P)-dependent dehydrogenase (short-subunit alcohol dehydrogenase family)
MPPVVDPLSSKPNDKPASPLPDVVLVTGSSSGIGQACCDRLANSGRRVYGASRTPCVAERWTYVAMDVTDDASVARAVGEVLRREGRIDALVHCAGISVAGSFEDTTVEEAKRQFDTNFFGAVRTLRAILPAMRKQGAGKLVVVGSIGGLMGLPYIGYYSASKFALDGLVQALRMEIRPFGIEATVVHPGDFNTAISANQILCANATSDSAYFAACQRTIEIYDTNVRGARPADVVARKIERLLSRRRLPVRSVLGTPTEVMGVWLKSVLPSRGFEYLFRKSYKL